MALKQYILSQKNPGPEGRHRYVFRSGPDANTMKYKPFLEGRALEDWTVLSIKDARKFWISLEIYHNFEEE
jgi:hypothetical protein|tara:strand:- start:95 stop:307 length:213 start_codon:yes stop_codon:yes gene_type:complete